MWRVSAIGCLLWLALATGSAAAAGPPITTGGWVLAGDNQPVNFQTPAQVPPSGIDEDEVYTTSIVSVLGVPHVAWTSVNFFSFRPEHHVRAAKLVGSTWQQFQGHLGTDENSNAGGIELEAFGGEMHYVWIDQLRSSGSNDQTSRRLFVAKVDPGGSGPRTYLGSGQNPLGNSTDLNVDLDSETLTNVGNVPHVVWWEQHPGGGILYDVKAKRWDGANWVADGSGIVEDSTNFEPSATSAAIGGQLHVAYEDDLTIRVKRFDGTNWVELGSGLNPGGNGIDPSIADIGGVPYVAWAADAGGDGRDIKVSRWTGSAWEPVGTGVAPVERVPARDAESPALTSVGGVAHIAWVEAFGESGGVRRIHAARLEGGEWREIAGNSVRPINVTNDKDGALPSIANVGGVPYVAWLEDTHIWIKKFGTLLANATRPVMSGTPQVGTQLTCSEGTWTGGTPDSFEWIWERAPGGVTADDDPGWNAIDGAVGDTYTVQTVDEGSQVRCRVFASDSAGSGEAVSLSKRAELGVPANTVRPQVNGLPVARQELECGTGTWKSGREFSFRWLRDGAPIAGATSSRYTLVQRRTGEQVVNPSGDGGHKIACDVTSTNGLGTAGPVASDAVDAVDEVPHNTSDPQVLDEGSSPNPLGRTLRCHPGDWLDDYSQRGTPEYHYEFLWRRGGEVIGGETQSTYVTKVDDLGRDVSCGVSANNPAGRSDYRISFNNVFVPLPAVASQGEMLTAEGKNQFVPVNMLAVGREFRAEVERYIVETLTAAKDAETTRCEAKFPIRTLNSVSPTEQLSEPLGEKDRCRLLLLSRFRILVQPNGVKYQDRCSNPAESCLDLGFAIPPVDPLRPTQTDPLAAARLAPVTPTNVLWDIDRDGRTDVNCPGTTPVLRTMLERGQWSPRAIIVYPDSATTGIFSEASKSFPNPRLFSNLPPGRKRPAQPLSCRTSLEQPPEPQQMPCVGEGTIGKVRVVGNLCPISVRSLTESQISEMRVNDEALFDTLVQMSRELENKEAADNRARIRVLATPDAMPELMPRGFQDAASRRVSATFGNYASALPGFQLNELIPGRLAPVQLSDAVIAKAKLVEQKAQFALDQIYIARDTLKVNGVTVDPLKSATLLVPSDVKDAFTDAANRVEKMKIYATDAASKVGDLVLAEGGRVATEFTDRAGAAGDKLLRHIDFADIKKRIEKLKIGPFKLAGDVDIKMEDDMTATVEAWASIPLLKDGFGATPTARLKFRGDLDGNLKLEGLEFKLAKARLGPVGGVKIEDLFLRYENGLTVRGKLLIDVPPSRPKIEIFEFRMGPNGEFRALDIRFSATPGIAVGPGIFLTALRAGLDLDASTLNGGATLSAGPSPGGGCPTVGIDATFRVRFADVLAFDAHGNIQIVCIGLVSVDFHADSDGYIALSGGLDFSAGPLFLTSKIGGSFKLPNWQIEYRGAGGIRGIPIVGTLSAELQGVLSNRGMAVCGRVEILFATLAAGAGVRFPNGHPPLSPDELFHNFHIFTGCDLSSYRSLPSVVGGHRAHVAQAGGRGFDIAGGSRGIALSIEGAGAAPHVRLRSPSGKVYDFTDAAEPDGKLVDNAYGVIVEDEDKTAVLMKSPEQGRWSVEPGEGSTGVVKVERADVLPPIKVTGTVGGIGSSRVLRYNVQKIPGQVVRLVEEADGAEQTLRTVRGGGRGTIRFQVAEAQGTRRTISAEVQQDGLGRDNVVVARFNAPNPKVGAPRRVRVRRRGGSAVVTWRKAVNAKTYDVGATTSSGQNRIFSVRGRRLRLVVPGVPKRERLTVKVVGISAHGNRGPVARGKVAAVKKKKRRARRRG